MPANTTKYVVPYPQSSDTVASLAATVQNLANRVDLLLGESGLWTIAMTANTLHTTAITLARTYPGNATGSTPGIVIVTPDTIGASATVMTSVINWTGTATTVTGFTLQATSTNATTRKFLWRFIPVL